MSLQSGVRYSGASPDGSVHEVFERSEPAHSASQIERNTTNKKIKEAFYTQNHKTEVIIQDEFVEAILYAENLCSFLIAVL